MVYYSLRAQADIDQILISLTYWKKHTLEYDEILAYVADIKEEGNSLSTKIVHSKATYIIHKAYGDYVHTYKRNSRTCWYFIYTQDLFDDIFIWRIMNNYMTIG